MSAQRGANKDTAQSQTDVNMQIAMLIDNQRNATNLFDSIFTDYFSCDHPQLLQWRQWRNGELELLLPDDETGFLLQECLVRVKHLQQLD